MEQYDIILQNLHGRHDKFILAGLYISAEWVAKQISYVVEHEPNVHKWKNYLLPESQDISLASSEEGWIPWDFTST